MADKDFLDRIQAGRDAMRRVQQSLARYALSAEQRQAIVDGMTRLAMPGDQLQSIVDMVDAFGPPLAQVETVRAELAEQRRAVQEFERRLARLEGMIERLATASEQLVAFQEPFVKMAAMFTGQTVDRAASRPTAADPHEPSPPADGGPEATS
jgi:hypothetical protein